MPTFIEKRQPSSRHYKSNIESVPNPKQQFRVATSDELTLENAKTSEIMAGYPTTKYRNLRQNTCNLS
jgi:hypothetical protein